MPGENIKYGTTTQKRTVAVNLHDLVKRNEEIIGIDLPDSENGFYFWAEDCKERPVDGMPELPLLKRAYIPTTNAARAVSELRDAGLTNIKLKERKIGKMKAHLPSGEELAEFADDFADTFETTDITSVVRLLASTQLNPTMQIALENVVVGMLHGEPIDVAFANQRDEKGRVIFPVGLIAAFKVGAEVGASKDVDTGKSVDTLVVTLKAFAESERSKEEIRRRIKTALSYPKGVVYVCLAIISGLLYFFMPKMKELYAGLSGGKDDQLPAFTQMLLDLSDFLTTWYGLLTVGIFVGIFIAFKRWLKSEKGVYWYDEVKLHLPIFGKFYRLSYGAESLRVLALLSSGGAPMQDRFKIASQAAGNRVYRERLEHAAFRFSQRPGELAPLFKGDAFYFGENFDSLLVNLSVSGKLQHAFHRYARTLEKQANRELEKLLSKIERYAMIPVGVVIGACVIAIYLPLLQLGSHIK